MQLWWSCLHTQAGCLGEVALAANRAECARHWRCGAQAQTRTARTLVQVTPARRLDRGAARRSCGAMAAARGGDVNAADEGSDWRHLGETKDMDGASEDKPLPYNGGTTLKGEVKCERPPHGRSLL